MTEKKHWTAIDWTFEEMDLISKASEKEMRSKRNFVKKISLERAKELVTSND